MRALALAIALALTVTPALPYGGGGESAGPSAISTEPAETPATKDLVSAVKTEADPDVRATAAVSMGQFPRSSLSTQTLASVLRDPAEPVALRSVAAVSLGNQGAAGNAAPLHDALGDQDPLIRRHAVLGLGMLKQPGTERSIGGRLGDPDPQVRVTAARALAFAGSPEAHEALAASVREDQDPLVRLEALRTLIQTNGATEKLLDHAMKHDADAEVRELARVGHRALPAAEAARKAAAPAASASPSAPASPAPVTLASPAAAPSAATPPPARRRKVKLESDGEETEEAAGEQAACDHAESPAPAASPIASAAPGELALKSTTALPRTTGTANGESGRTVPGEPIDQAISRLAARLAPGAADDAERLRTMHELAPLIDQAAYLGSRVVPLAPVKGRWFLTAHDKVSEHENLIKSTFVNEHGAMFRAGSGQPHLPGSTYVVYRFKDENGKPGALSGIGAYTYTRLGTPVFKHFGTDGKLDTFSSPKVNAQTCFACHDNKDAFAAKDFTFDTFEKAHKNGIDQKMEAARTRTGEAQ